MKSSTLLTAARVCVAALAIAVPSAWGQTFTTFDPPESLATSPGSINPAGQIVGSYFDANFVNHCFLRDTDGTITSIDAPGAINGTCPIFIAPPPFITPQGSIVGTYFDANFNLQPFLRAKDGTFPTFEMPTPGAVLSSGLVANSAGAITGVFSENSNPHVFVRAPSGKITLFDFPPAFLTFIPNPFPGATPLVPSIVAMTPGGTIVGSYFDSNGAIHGFLRTIDGTFTTFDAPNADTSPFFGTTPTAINDSGTVTGQYFDTTLPSFGIRIFLRTPNGVFSNFDTPQLGTSLGSGSINSSGAVAGDVLNFECPVFPFCNIVPISFVRAANGTVSSVNDPKAVQGTFVTGINPAGVVIGNYIDANNVQHGFVMKP